MIVVTGATGSIGRELMRLLGEEALAVVRRPLDGGRFVLGDLDRPESIPLARGDRLFLNSSLWPGFVQRHKEVVDLAAKAGVAQIVTVSVRGAEPGGPLGTGMHGEVDDHLMASGVPYAILRPVGFMQNLIAEVRTGDIHGSYGQARVGYIDARDIAAVGAALLTGPVGESAVHVLTGPDSRSHAEIAEAVSAALGRPVRYVDLPIHEAAEHHVRIGIPEPYATTRARMTRELGDERWASTTTVVADVTGKAPRTLEEFLADHLAEFTGR